MKHTDQKLHEIEEQLETFISVPSSPLESKKKLEYSKMQQVTNILEGVRNIRARIALNIQLKTSSREPFREWRVGGKKCQLVSAGETSVVCYQ